MRKKITMGVMALMAVMMLVLSGCSGKTILIQGETGGGTSVYTDRADAATLTLNAFTGSWGKEGAKVEVYPDAYTVLKHTGVDGKERTEIISDAAANTTSNGLVEGDVVDIYCTGATYYCKPKLNFAISSVSPIAELEAYTVTATTGLVITMYDEDDNTLTADDNATNTADYAGGDVVATDAQVYFAKISQTTANRNFQLDTICTYILGDEADDMTLESLSPAMVSAGYKFDEINTPDAMTSILMTDDTGANTSEKGWKNCYQLNKPFMMSENMDTGKLKFVFDSDDTTAPTANGDTYFGIGFLDGAYSVDKNGVVEYGSYMDDDTEDAGTVGLDENIETTANGLDVVVAVEPQ